MCSASGVLSVTRAGPLQVARSHGPASSNPRQSTDKRESGILMGCSLGRALRVDYTGGTSQSLKLSLKGGRSLGPSRPADAKLGTCCPDLGAGFACAIRGAMAAVALRIGLGAVAVA